MPESGSCWLPAKWDGEFSECPANHHYCYGIIHLFLDLVLRTACSLEGASAVLRLMRVFLPWAGGIPIGDSGQFWMLRVGLYEISRTKELTDDRIWIVDHTIQIGTTKCLLILSCRLSWWQENRGTLSHRDLEVLALEPVTKSDGAIVCKQLEETADKVGVPRAIVSDHGSDIKRGIATFQVNHPDTVSLYDIAHKMAILIKRELAGDEHWSTYLQHIGQTKQCVQQTSLAYLMPPTPKNKARFMNLEPLVNWGTKALAYLDNPQPVDDQPVDKKRLKEKLRWLRPFRRHLKRWDTMMRIVAITLKYIRQEGYHRRATGQLRQKLKPIAKDRPSRRLMENTLAFVKEQSALAQKNEHLIGSSECIESLIGKGKRLEGQQSKSGFTRMVLGMAAAVVEPTKDYLEKALDQVKTRDVVQWCKEKLGASVQSQKQRALKQSMNGTKTG